MTPHLPPRCPLTVLVVDDLRDAADSMGDLLTLCGYTARVTYRGEDALRLAAAAPPDVVLLDLAMPGMDGWDLARRLRDEAGGKRPLLVAVSGYGDAAARRRSADAGIDLHLVKPVDGAVLVGVLKRFGRVLGPAGPGVARRYSALLPSEHLVADGGRSASSEWV